jgi:hypothetical protein
VSSADPEQPAARDETPPDEPARAGSRWSGGRVVGLVFTSLAGLLGLAMLVGGLALIAAHAFVRDDDGYYASGDELIETTGYAVATGEIDLGADPADWAPRDLLVSSGSGSRTPRAAASSSASRPRPMSTPT